MLQVRDSSRVFDTQLVSERCFQRSLCLPDLVKVPVRSTEIRPSLFIVAQHISHELDALRFHFVLGSTHILDLEANDGAVVELVIATFGAEHLKPLPRRQLKLHQPFAIAKQREDEFRSLVRTPAHVYPSTRTYILLFSTSAYPTPRCRRQPAPFSGDLNFQMCSLTVGLKLSQFR